MKLIIDIDEDVYKLFTGNGQGMKVVRFNLENTLKNGTPLEEELENLKTEIRHKSYIQEEYGDISVNTVMWIIDKRISELKGE